MCTHVYVGAHVEGSLKSLTNTSIGRSYACVIFPIPTSWDETLKIFCILFYALSLYRYHSENPSHNAKIKGISNLKVKIWNDHKVNLNRDGQSHK